MEKRVLDIVEKVRMMFKYDKRFKELLAGEFHVIIAGKYQPNKEAASFEVKKVVFGVCGEDLYEDSEVLEINSDEIVYVNDEGEEDVLIEYKGFDELLEL